MSVLPGEPTDGSGRICVHLFVRDETARFTEPHVLHPALNENSEPVKGKLVARPTKGRLACDRNRDFRPHTLKGVTTVTSRTESTEAVTCPKCKLSREYQELTSKEQ